MKPGLKPSVIAMTHSATSHLLPVFARVDLGFERGEGCWLTATNGDRYLDFTSGVAVSQQPSPLSKPRSTLAKTGSRCDVALLVMTIT